MALVTSRTIGRKCPICGAANSSCGGPSSHDGLIIVNAPTDNGELVWVEVKPGLSIKMRKAEALAKGLLKMGEPVKNKMASPARNKGRKGKED
jgi:hypothetical protein